VSKFRLTFLIPPMSAFCRGTTDGNPCECEEYSPQVNPDPSQPARCAECLHGKSKHPKLELSSSGLAKPAPETVRDIFKKITQEPTKTSLSEARSETLEGFRKASGSSSRSVSASKVNEADFYLTMTQKHLRERKAPRPRQQSRLQANWFKLPQLPFSFVVLM
jgi:hypothetical protein